MFFRKKSIGCNVRLKNQNILTYCWTLFIKDSSFLKYWDVFGEYFCLETLCLPIVITILSFMVNRRSIGHSTTCGMLATSLCESTALRASRRQISGVSPTRSACWSLSTLAYRRRLSTRPSHPPGRRYSLCESTQNFNITWFSHSNE